ncbi:hypothetical protein [Alkalihalobacillus sp. AL-G]|uniref:hypothetical protein n=1 Tax=Alkalihalobacillus sp. AL-G TaxID=2926399 RepID=UPI00272C95F5|nr:hypothetical protein [Alkalihalobacillus sp. AL-G]WLD94968.1 hypothetical protein MOJ78_08830 [Alkalihalobacillus sp. AL-G]
MNSQKELSYDRLASRTKYYQEKSLQLEKKLLFAEDQIEQLETKLKDALENDELQQELEKTTKQLNEHKQEVIRLTEQLSETNLHTMESRVLAFEELLESVEKEINEKDKQIESYRNKIKSLEKRAKVQNQTEQIPDDFTTENIEKDDLFLSAYFNYSLICKEENSYVIHGSFHLMNNGKTQLENPLVCFRFQPIDYTKLKGKISSMDHTPTEEKSDTLQWVYLENDWAKDALTRGEIWIAPMYDLTIPVNQSITITDFQIPIQKQFEDSITIEGFVYFPNQEYRARAVNQIALNF